MSLESGTKNEPKTAKEERFSRRWALQYIFGHLSHAATGKPISPYDIDYLKRSAEHKINPSDFQAIALDPDRTAGLMRFLIEKVCSGEMRYDGDEPLKAFESIEGIHAVGAQLLAQSRARRAEIATTIQNARRRF